MKKVLIAFMALFCLTTYAQDNRNEKREMKKEMRERGPKLNPEQRAELKTKKMALHLDLSEAQQKKISNLELERAKLRTERKVNRSEGKKLSDNERFEMKSQRLDEQIAHKKELKSILSEEQYKKWEMASRDRRQGKQGKGNNHKRPRGKHK